MPIVHEARCDNCGNKMAITPHRVYDDPLGMGRFDEINEVPAGWLIPVVCGNSMQQRVGAPERRPCLCSWGCLATYAEGRQKGTIGG